MLCDTKTKNILTKNCKAIALSLGSLKQVAIYRLATKYSFLMDRIKAGIRDGGGVLMEFPVYPIQETTPRPKMRRLIETSPIWGWSTC